MRVETLVLDVVVVRMLKARFQQQLRLWGVDVLVNNAGLAQGLDPFQDSTVDDAVTMIDTNVKGLLYVTKAVTTLYGLIKNAG